jgi:hypothetical protein
MTQPIALSPDFEDLARLQRSTPNLRKAAPSKFLSRMERLDVKRDYRTAPIKSPPQHLDAALLKERQALEDAWGVEIEKLILMKRTRSAEAVVIATAARAATALVVRRIEMARAMTLDGLKVKARAASWRRHGEPSPVGKPRSVAIADWSNEPSAAPNG